MAVQIANARADAGDESYLYVLTGPGELSSRISPAVTVRYFGYWRASVANPVRFAVSLHQGYRLLRRQARQDRLDVLQCHLPGANFWGLLLALGDDRTVVPTVHSNQEFNYGAVDQPLRGRLRRMAYRAMLRRCAAMIAVSEGVRDSLLTELGRSPAGMDRIRVIPNGVVIPERESSEVLERTRTRYGLRRSAPIILGAGRLTELKNFPVLIDAVASLRAEGIDCQLLIAGDGPLRDTLMQRILERELVGTAFLPGHIDDLPLLMQAADVFVLPSQWEGLPLVLLEAMASGLPAVGSRIAGIAEVLDDGVNGLLVEPGDAVGLTVALRRMLTDAGQRAQWAIRGRETIIQRFDFQRVITDLGRLYRELAATGR